VRAFLINLDRCTERLAWIADQFAFLGIAFERIPAVDGSAMSSTAREAFTRERPSTDWLPGQIGCFLSHLHAWQLAANGSDQIISIFEDDIHISDDIREFMLSSEWFPNNADIVRFETTRQGVILEAPSRTVLGRKICEVRSEIWGAGGYCIRKSTAAFLINTPPTHHLPVDSFLFNKSTSASAQALRTHQVVPALCIQDKYIPGMMGRARFASSIEPQEFRHRKTIGTTFRKIMRFAGGRRRIAFK
jgi:glycosyl transferase, family 25